LVSTMPENLKNKLDVASLFSYLNLVPSLLDLHNPVCTLFDNTLDPTTVEEYIKSFLPKIMTVRVTPQGKATQTTTPRTKTIITPKVPEKQQDLTPNPAMSHNGLTHG
jgi:hypothetical protein